MSARIQREFSVIETVNMTASASTSQRIPCRTMAGGFLFVNTVAGASTITWYVAPDNNTTPVPATDSAGNAIPATPITAGKGFAIPDALWCAHVICPVLNAGTASGVATLKA